MAWTHGSAPVNNGSPLFLGQHGPDSIINHPGFILTSAPKIPVDVGKLFVMTLPDFCFTATARTFRDFDVSSARACTYLAVFELWLFVLHVVKEQITKNHNDQANYPLKVYLETLRSTDGHLTNSHRLWMIEVPGAASPQLGQILCEAVDSDKSLDQYGSFENLNTASHQGPQSAGQAIVPASDGGKGKGKGKSGGKGGGSGGGAIDEEAVAYLEKYKCIHDMYVLAHALDVILGVTKYTADLSTQTGCDARAIFDVFNFRQALALTPRHIVACQRDPATYLVAGKGLTEPAWSLQFPFFKDVFHLPPFIFHPRCFMMITFPSQLVDPIQLKWTEYMMELAEKSKRVYEAEQRRRHAAADDRRRPATFHRRAMGPDAGKADFSGILDTVRARNDERGHRSTVESALENLIPCAIVNPDVDAEDGPPPTRDDEPTAAVGPSIYRKPVPITEAQVSAAASFFGISMSMSQHGLGDAISMYSLMYQSEALMLKDAHKDRPPAEFGTKMEMLNSVVINKFRAHCMDRYSEVSRAQRILNREFTEHNMAQRHFLLPIGDPSKTVIENALIWLNAGWTLHGAIANSQSICTFGYIGGGNRFQRTLDLHFNLALCGPAATSKSTIMDAVLRAFGKDSCMQANTASDQAYSWNNVDTDQMVYSDDASILNELNKDGGCVTKSRLTTMTNQRFVLFLEPERHTEVVKNVAIGVSYTNRNETAENVKTDNSQQAATIDAIHSRFVNVDVPAYNNTLLTVAQAISMQKQKTDEQLRNDNDFFLALQKIHTVIGWAQKLEDISHDSSVTDMFKLVKVEMGCFNMVYNFLERRLRDKGIKPAHPRVPLQAYMWCYQLVLFDAYLHANCLEHSPFYGQDFDIAQVRSWTPVCYEHHVFLTISYFFPLYYSMAMEPTLNALAYMFTDSRQCRDDKVVFSQQYRAEKKLEQQQRLTMIVDNAKKAAAGDDDDDGGNGGDQKTAKKKKTPPPPPPPPPATGGGGAVDATYVHFRGYTMQDAAVFIETYHKGIGASMQIGSNAVMSALKSLQRLPVRAPPYVFESATQEVPTSSRQAKITTKQGLIVHNQDKTFSVHYHVLSEGGSYRDVLRSVIKMYAHRHTLERQIILALEDPVYPWLFQAMTIPQTERTIRMANDAYLPETTLLALFNTTSRSVLQLHQRSPFVNIDQNINLTHVQKFFRDKIAAEWVTEEFVASHTPERMCEQLRRVADMKIAGAVCVPGSTTAKFAYYTYPNDQLKEYRIMKDINQRELDLEAEQDPHNPVPGDGREKIPFDGPNPQLSIADFALDDDDDGPPPGVDVNKRETQHYFDEAKGLVPYQSFNATLLNNANTGNFAEIAAGLDRIVIKPTNTSLIAVAAAGPARDAVLDYLQEYQDQLRTNYRGGINIVTERDFDNLRNEMDNTAPPRDDEEPDGFMPDDDPPPRARSHKRSRSPSQDSSEDPEAENRRAAHDLGSDAGSDDDDNSRFMPTDDAVHDETARLVTDMRGLDK